VDLGPGHVIFGMLLHPRVIQASVIGDKIQQQSQPALPKAVAKARQGCITSKVGVDRIAGNGKSGTGNILRAQVRQRLLKLPAPFWVAARDPLSSRPVCHTLKSHTQSKPSSARRSNSASGMSSSVAGRRSARASCVSQTRVLI